MKVNQILTDPKNKGYHSISLTDESDKELYHFTATKGLRGRILSSILLEARKKFPELKLTVGRFFNLHKDNLLEFIDFLEKEKKVLISPEQRAIVLAGM